VIGADDEAHPDPDRVRRMSVLDDDLPPLTIDWGRVMPLIGSLVCAVIIFVGLARVDDAAQRASWLETSGQARGSIVDQFGHPLAYTVPTRQGAERVFSIPGLSPILGYRAPDGRWHGLESTYSPSLDAVAARKDWRTYVSHLIGRVARGDTVRLTLSRHVQLVANAALGKASGAVVALDPRTGAVLAMVSKPSCSDAALNRPEGYSECSTAATAPLVNRATARAYSPGSDFKIVTLTTALDTGRFHLTDVFSGADAFGPSPYFDNTLYPSNVTRADLHALTLSQALAFSDNFTFAHIGLELGAPALIGYAHRFFVGRKIPFDLPVVVSSIANAKARPSKSETAQSAFGGEVDKVTLLQMALVAGTVANGGILMAPHLFESLQAPGGKVLRRYLPTSLGRVMSAATATEVTTAMSFVVNHGSGFNAQIRGIQVAGKTGTAASGGNRPNAWFICFAPAKHPVVAVAVLHQFSGEGFEYAAPVARTVLIAALDEYGFNLK
jgi:peptidoglycan glycosyltransferase